MLVRVVHMHFTEEGVAKFLGLFGDHEHAIRNMRGCLRMELMRDVDDPLHFMTLSHWDTVASLDAYRETALFRSLWPSVKTLFSERSRAYSFEKFIP